MKGIIYLVETAISAVLIVIVLSFFLTVQGIRTSFERADLISIGNNILLNLKYNNKLNDLLKGHTDEINKLKPPNVDFAVSFSSSGTEQNLNIPAANKDTVGVSTFTTTCCDKNETVEIILTLWYRF